MVKFFFIRSLLEGGWITDRLIVLAGIRTDDLISERPSFSEKQGVMAILRNAGTNAVNHVIPSMCRHSRHTSSASTKLFRLFLTICQQMYQQQCCILIISTRTNLSSQQCDGQVTDQPLATKHIWQYLVPLSYFSILWNAPKLRPTSNFYLAIYKLSPTVPGLYPLPTQI